MAESDKPSELVNAVRGLMVCAALVVLGVVMQNGASGWLQGAGALGFLYFLVATLWALGARAASKR